MLRRIQQFWQRSDPGFLLVLLLSLIALWPFLSRAGLPQETDTELHVFRLFELSYLIRGGEFYPRWAPNFYHGYGYPIFNYYAPLAYYVGLVVELLPRLDAVAGIKFVYILGLLLAAFGTYGFVRDNWGRSAGLVAAALYIYAPYLQYIDPHARGALAESFSLGLFPMALWALDRLRRQPDGWRLVTAVGGVAAVILSHNLMALLFFAILVAWTIWPKNAPLANPETAIARRSTIKLILGALALGLLLAAFFWVPVALERNDVNLTTLIGEGDNYDFRTHFLDIPELLALSLRLDWGATEPVFRFNLGVAQWIFGGLGFVLLLFGKSQQRQHLAFFGLGLALLLFLMLPASTFIWEMVPLLPFFQFPWRLLGAANFALAVLGGASITYLLGVTNGRWRTAVLLVGLALPLLLGLPASQPAPWPEFGPLTMLRMNQIEHKGRWLGTTSTADYVPVTVDSTPPPNPEVVRGFYEDRPLDRVNRATIPEGVTVTADYLRPLLTRYQVSTPKDFRLRLFQFDFPGWQVRIDGERIESELGRPEGFLVIPVPAGDHEVEVRFGSTPARNLGWLLTLAALLVTLFLGWRSGKSADNHSVWSAVITAPERRAFGLVLGLMAVFMFLLQPLNLLHYQSEGNDVAVADQQVSADFGRQIALVAYDTSATQTQPGESLSLHTYLRAQESLDINYQSFVHILAPDGTLVAQSDKLNPGDFPTHRWPLDKYVRDDHLLSLPQGLPPGDYQVTAGFWVQAEGWRLPLLDESGSQLDDKFILFTLQVTAP